MTTPLFSVTWLRIDAGATTRSSLLSRGPFPPFLAARLRGPFARAARGSLLDAESLSPLKPQPIAEAAALACAG